MDELLYGFASAFGFQTSFDDDVCLFSPGSDGDLSFDELSDDPSFEAGDW